MLESKSEVAGRLVAAVAEALHELYVRPMFPNIKWDENTPRRMAGPTVANAAAVTSVLLTQYEATMKLNGYQLPTLLGPEESDGDI